jgi:hypothetical protein
LHRVTTRECRCVPAPDTGIIFVDHKSARNDARLLADAQPGRERVGRAAGTRGAWTAMREGDPRETDEDHVDLARGIAIGIVVGILMWGLAALILWAMWR